MTKDKTVTAILAAMEREDGINLHEYPIKITHSDTLKLEGEVESIEAKRKALLLASRAVNGASIEDCLRLTPGERRVGTALLNAVLSALMQEPAFAEIEIIGKEQVPPLNGRGRIGVSVEGCVVTLNGQLGSLSHRRLAEVITWWVPGCCDVKNCLTVSPAEDETDDEISDAIRLVFDKEPSLNADEISISTRNSEVTLRGVVHSSEQRRIACYDCWYVPGVNAVHNELQIRPR